MGTRTNIYDLTTHIQAKSMIDLITLLLYIYLVFLPIELFFFFVFSKIELNKKSGPKKKTIQICQVCAKGFRKTQIKILPCKFFFMVSCT